MLYINDIQNCAPLLSKVLFADDTTLFLSDVNYDNIILTFNSELSKVNQYLNANRLSLNIDKTFSMFFSNRPSSINLSNVILINDEIINFQNSTKFLGVFIDNKLSYQSHINHLLTKLSKTIGILFKIRNSAPRSIKILIYNCLFYPYLIYAILIWGKTSNIHLDKILLLQKKAVRIISSADYLAHTDPLFKQNKILKIHDLFTFYGGIFAFKQNQNSNLPARQHSHDTRGRNQALPAFNRLHSTQRSLSYVIPSIWNSIPNNIKDVNSLSKFKNKLNDYLLDFY